MGLQEFAVATGQAIARSLPGVDVRYQLFVDNLFVPTTGGQEDSFYDVHVFGAEQSYVTAQDVAAMPAVLQVGDLRLAFPLADLEADLPRAKAHDVSTRDLVTVGTTLYRVIGIEKTSMGRKLRVYARRQG